MYEEKEERFTTEEVKKGVEDFLKYAGYTILEPKYMGFTRPDIHVTRKEGNKKHEIVGVIKKDLSLALEGYRELAAAKCSMGNKEVDYALILPPVSEYFTLAFLIREEEWWYTIKDHSFMMWLANPEREKVDCLVGWPSDDIFNDFFGAIRGLDGVLSREAAKKMMDEEF